MQKTKQVLFVDPILQKGHVGFNQIYIEALRKENVELSFVFVKGYEKKLNISKKSIVYALPRIFFVHNFGGLINRIILLIGLLLIRINVNFSKYDKVIFSSFEEISFYFSGIRNVFIINHINVSKSTSKVKFFFLKKTLNRNTCIVFDKITKKYLDEKGDFKIVVKPHGLLKQYSKTHENQELLDTRLSSNNIRHYIFSPSSNSSDIFFLNKTINNPIFSDFLEKHSILLVLKGEFETQDKNVVVISKMLSKNMYTNLFAKSTLILIAYPDRFKYRVSGVLFECFANNKICLVKNNGMLASYMKHFCYDPYFSTLNELIDAVEKIIKGTTIEFPYKDLELLNPNFKDLIDA